ncbi:iron dependent repressor, metal binding and dimerization domain protein [Lacrimispora sp.]
MVACCKVNEETASKDACKIEHFISDESVMALEKYCSEIK